MKQETAQKLKEALIETIKNFPEEEIPKKLKKHLAKMFFMDIDYWTSENYVYLAGGN